jgi:mannan endo-1,4-beta-mannosidase
MWQVILSFINNWGTTGGIDEFVAWSGSAKRHQDFYTDATCKSLYKAHVKTIIQRINSINGRRLAHLPLIMHNGSDLS